MSVQQDKKDARILIIEDEANERAIIKMVFLKDGYKNVLDTDNVSISLNKIDEGGVDLVICDWHMPTVTGLEVLKAVRARDGRLPFIMLTAERNRERVMAALEAGCTDYVAKPISRKILLQKVKAVLDKFY